MEKELIEFLTYIHGECCDEYGHIQITRNVIERYESESIEGVVKEYLKNKQNVSKDKN